MTSTSERRRSGLTLALLAFAQFVIAIDYNIVYVALPDIGDKLGFSAQSLQWVVSAYAVAFGGFLLFGGRAVDRIGGRRVFLAAFAVYGAASLVGGLSTGSGLLIAARAAQGLGAALLFPATLTLIFLAFPEGPGRTRALAVWGGSGSAGLAAGALLGGVLTDWFGWPAVFLINVPLAVVAMAVAPRLLPADRPQPGRRGGFDLPGALLVTIAVSVFVFGIASGPDAGWLSTRGAGAIAVGVLGVALFALREARVASPLMPLRMFRVRSLSVTLVVIFIFMGALSTEYYLFTQYVQGVLKYDALHAGFAFLPLGLFSVVGAGPLSTAAARRFGMRTTLAVGMAGVAAGTALIAAGMAVGGSYWAMVPAITVWGLLGGMTFATMYASAAVGVDPAEQGVASALASTAQQVGGAVVLAILVAVANAGLDTHSGHAVPAAALVHGFRTASWVTAVAALGGALVALGLRRAGALAQGSDKSESGTDAEEPLAVAVSN